MYVVSYWGAFFLKDDIVVGMKSLEFKTQLHHILIK